MDKSEQTGVIICGHGSRNQKGVEAFAQMVNTFSDEFPQYTTTYAFLELQKPTFEEAIVHLKNKGIHDIVVLPAFLFNGIHISEDIPIIFWSLNKSYPEVRIRMAGFIGLIDPFVDLLVNRIRNFNIDIARSEILMVGVGASVASANSDFAGLSQLIWDKSQAAHVSYSFISDFALPKFADALKISDSLEVDNLIILPVLLFPGYYLSQIENIISDTRRIGQKVIFTQSIGNDKLFPKCLKYRLDEVLNDKVDLIAEIHDEHSLRRTFELKN